MSNTQQELADLREQVRKLGESGSLESIDIATIYRSPWQARRTITNEIVQKKASSLLKEGQKEPIVIYPIDDIKLYRDGLQASLSPEEFERVIKQIDEDQITHLIQEGEIRWRAALELVQQGHSKFQHLKAFRVASPKNIEELHHRSMVHGTQDEEINDLDLIEGIILQLTYRLRDELPADETSRQETLVATIRSIANLMKKHDPKILDELKLTTADLEKVADQILEKIGTAQVPMGKIHKGALIYIVGILKQNIFTVSNNHARLLKLKPDLKEAVRQGLGSFQALELNKLEDNETRTNLLTEVLENKLSIQKTKDKVKAIVGEQRKPNIHSKALQQLKTIDFAQQSSEDLHKWEQELKLILEQIQKAKEVDR